MTLAKHARVELLGETSVDPKGIEWMAVKPADSSRMGWVRRSDLKHVEVPSPAWLQNVVDRFENGGVSTEAHMCALALRQALGWESMGDAPQWPESLRGIGWQEVKRDEIRPGTIVYKPGGIGHVGILASHEGRLMFLSMTTGHAARGRVAWQEIPKGQYFNPPEGY